MGSRTSSKGPRKRFKATEYLERVGPQEERVRALVTQKIVECKRCPLSSQAGVTPVPIYGPTPSDILVIGEAPGEDENREGKPFIGRSGVLLREAMGRVGLIPKEMAWANSASCWPRPFGEGNAPKDWALKACFPHLRRQINLADPRFVLLVGGVALQRVRPDLRISKTHGKPLKGRKRVWFPVWHPSYILQNGGEHSEPYLELIEDLGRFASLVQ